MDPQVLQDPQQLKKLGRQLGELREPVEAYEALLAALEDEAANSEALADPELRELAEMETEEIAERIATLDAQLEELLAPKDPNNGKDAILEIRPGAGGEEAALFADELLRSYLRFAESQGLKARVAERQESASGEGIKEAVVEIEGVGAYGLLKFEAGVHRVQRIPTTESQGRVHTSAVSVVVLPVVEQEDYEIRNEDLRIDTYRASGAGGQHVNTTDSAIRVTHIPTGVVATCQDGRSQHQNKEKALEYLRSKLAAAEEEKRLSELGEKRLAQIGSGDRSDKIRTYNFPQDRVTDHRLPSELKNYSNIPNIMNGGLLPIVESLRSYETEMMSQM